MSQRVLVPLPDHDFDVTEVAIPWAAFLQNKIEVVFATEKGSVSQADPLLLSGVIFGKLGAKPEAIQAYRQLEKSKDFQKPISYASINVHDFDAIHLPGGHAPGMKPYLENQLLREKILAFREKKKIIGAICHGVLVLARTLDPTTSKSILYGHRVTALTKFLERTAYFLTFWKHGRYYRTYPAYVQEEVSQNLTNKTDFDGGESPWRPFALRHGNFLTARWPLDASLYAQELIQCLKESA